MHSSSHDITAAQQALAGDPLNAKLHTKLGMAYFDEQRYGEALAAFERALVLDPHHPGAHNGVGRVHYHTGPPEAAVAAYTRAITIDPQYIPGYWGLGILYYAQLGTYDDAIAVFQRGLEANPEETHFFDGLGHAYARSGRFEEALEAYQVAAGHDPEVHTDIGIIHLNCGQYQEAVDAFQRAIDHNPTLGWAHRVLGFVYDRLWRYDEAVTAIERAVALDPDDYEARGGLVRAYRNVGRIAAAEEQRSIGHEQAAREDEYAQACFESASGNVDRAVALLRTALANKQLTPGWARLDPEFVFLQGDAGYEALLQ